MKTLLLTPWYTPHDVLSWKDAVTMKYEGKVDVLHEYGESVCSPSVEWKLPSVLRLKELSNVRYRGIKFSRPNVFIRDNYCCQYCGGGFTPRELTYDHVVPKSKGGKTDWDNIVACCRRCNSKKADKTCKQADMFPLNKPTKPRSMPYEPSIFEIEKAPSEWRLYLK